MGCEQQQAPIRILGERLEVGAEAAAGEKGLPGVLDGVQVAHGVT